MDMQGVQDTIQYIGKVMKQARGELPMEPDIEALKSFLPWLTKDDE